MNIQRVIRWGRAVGSIGLASLLLLVPSVGATNRSADSSPNWAAPTAIAIKRVSGVGFAQNEPVLLSNTDCALIDYRIVATNQQPVGCFTPTAFGLLDSDTSTTIFNGTDEGLPILGYDVHQVLVPWPQSLDVLALEPAVTGGSYLSMYTNPLTALKDQRNLLGQLNAKQLIRPPNLIVKDPAGHQLIINAQTIAFSSSGSWLVVENLNGSFVRINLATLDMVAFAPAYASLGGAGLQQSRVAISDDGRFAAIANEAADSFRVYDLKTCLQNGAINLQPQNCGSHDYLPYVKQQIGGLGHLRHIRFANEGLLSFEAFTSSADNTGVYAMAPTSNIRSLIDYLALGDSFTSGEGAFDYRSGTASSDNKCHSSIHAYPALLTKDLFSPLGGHSVACSGAVINDIGNGNDNYRGQVRNVASFKELQATNQALLATVTTNFLPGYIAQQRFVKQWQPRITTVSVGGDDNGFGDVVSRCVHPHLNRHPSDQTCFNSYEDRLELANLIDRTIPRWVSLYKQLQAEAPFSHIYAIGYPQLADDKGNCALNVVLSKSELEFAGEFVAYLNKDIRQAAAKAGVDYVDISQALVGHRLCETASFNVAVNGLTAGDDAGILGLKFLGKESYHPNALGQALIEQAILRQTRNFTTVKAATPVASNILKAPKTGRAINNVIPAKLVGDTAVRSGASTVVSAQLGGSLVPHSAYTIRLDGPSGQVIGSTVSDANGDISTTVALPITTPSGGHTIDITGPSQGNMPVDVTQPIIVPVSPTDSDGDGLPDPQDSCAGAPNSGHDSDQDGIDDVCDPLIGNPPPAPSSPSQTTSAIPTAPPDYGSPVTVVAQLELTGKAAIAGPVPPALQSGNVLQSGSQSGAVLGAKTVDLVHIAPKKLTVSGFRQPKQALQRPGLPSIDWLLWTGLFVLFWFVILLAGYLYERWLGGRRRDFA